MMHESTFGYSYFGQSFREVLRLVPAGFIVNGKQSYQWADIVGYRAFPDFYTDLAMAALASPKPRLALYVRDGRLIRIRGDLLVIAGKPRVSNDGIPEAFTELVKHVRENGISRWDGPTEEKVLFATAFILFAIGFFLTVGLAVTFRLFAPSIHLAIVAGVLVAQGAFIVAPLLAKRLRQVYIIAQG